MGAAVARISVTPVKGLRLLHPDEVSLTADGVPGDRAFFLVDAQNRMVSATRLGPLVAVVPEHDAAAGTLALRFPGGSEVTDRIPLGRPQGGAFYDERLHAPPVLGAFSEALSEHCGTSLRMLASPRDRPGVDRGSEGGVTLLSVASLERLREVAGDAARVDPRRFRMTFGVEGLEAHEEDGWIGREVTIGRARL